MKAGSFYASLIVLICSRLAIGLGLLASSSAVLADEFIELAIPLEDGRFYSPREFCAASNEKLGTHYILDRIPDRRFELTALEGAPVGR
ncbi:MAG TPA: hypothetical protein VFE01_10075 [Terracidiphilus sp.]|nr:hypothetical protein [Terracidiphilus sp.]